MIRALAFLLLLAPPAGAVEATREAAVLLREAGERLEQAEGARNRIGALTQAVRAYEAGLGALRQGLRQIAVREAALTGDLAEREERVSRLIGALAGIERTPAPLLLLHPEGPQGTARAAMLLGDAAPALEAEAIALRTEIDALRDVARLEEEAVKDLEAGLAGAQAAREALSIAISDRTDLPPRRDGPGVAQLLARAETLAAFADGLAAMPGPSAPAAPDLPLTLPADATLLRGYREADGAGIARPGLVLATAPAALVTAPAQASVRYAGPLLDYGLVIVLEPRPGALIVLAGLAEAYVGRGDILSPGAPVGLMGGKVPQAEQFRVRAEGGGGAFRSETLYLETREGGAPVDPSEWFDVAGSAAPANE